MLIYFVLMVPVAYSQWLEKGTKPWVMKLSAGVSAVMALALLFESAFRIFPPKSTAALYEGIHGWNELMAGANEELSKIETPKKAIAVMNWTLGSRAMFYNNAGSEVFVLDKRYDQFDIWQRNDPVGYDFVVVVEASKKEEHLGHLNCENLQLLGEALERA